MTANILFFDGTNLIDNPDYEVDAVGTFAQGGSTIVGSDAAAALAGAHSCKVTTANADDSGIGFRLRSGSRLPVTPGLSYTFGLGMWRPVGAGALTVRLAAVFFDGSAVADNTLYSADITVQDGWNYQTVAWTTPASRPTVQVYCLTHGAQGVANFWVDLATFELSSAFASLASPMPSPGDRFAGWTPDVNRIAASEIVVGSGRTSEFLFRRDYLATAALRNLPASTHGNALRLKEWLEQGGSCIVATGDTAKATYACCLAPSAKLKLSQSDPGLFEYSLALAFKNLADAPLTVAY